MASFESVPRFQKLASSDESDMSEGEIDDQDNKVAFTQDSSNASPMDPLQPNSSEILNDVKLSKKMEIVENKKNLNKKFSIWSEILMEEELNESMNNSLKLKIRRRRNKLRGEKESDNYSFWTREDFERKFATKKTNNLKKKMKSQEAKRDVAHDISQRLKESRIDIIRRIVQIAGEEKTRKLAAEVLDIESAGGMMTSDGNRRRSPGGVLFYLVKNESSISSDEKRSIFCDNIVKMNDKQMKKDKKNHAKLHKNNADKKKSKSKKKKNKRK